MRLGLFLLMLLGSWGLTCQPGPTAPRKFDHVLLIISDDLATHAVGCYGNTLIQTPHIDALASESVLFENAYANAPMCTPSRASLLTGLYPHAAGVTLLRTPLPDSVLTLAEYLHSQGFATGIFGKNHFNSALKHGFDTIVNNPDHRRYLQSVQQRPLPPGAKVRPPWKPFKDPASIWLNAEGASSGNYFAHSQGTFFARAGLDFMREHASSRFFAVVSFREPHSPFNFPVEMENQFRPESIQLPVAGPEDKRWIPVIFRDLRPEEKRGITRSYYQSVSYMDRNIGLLLDSLEQLGLKENTLVVFVGDHGYLLNHHGRFEKHMMWEEAVKTPLLIRGLGNGIRIQEPVELIDLVPTMVQALGLTPMPDLQGIALQALIQGEKPHRTHIISQYLTDNKVMIFDGRYKYIYSTGKRDLGSGYATGHGPSGPSHRLYDLSLDPAETHNLAQEAQEQDRIQSLQKLLLNHFRATHPAAALVAPDQSMEMQLSAFCEPPEGEMPGSL